MEGALPAVCHPVLGTRQALPALWSSAGHLGWFSALGAWRCAHPGNSGQCGQTGFASLCAHGCASLSIKQERVLPGASPVVPGKVNGKQGDLVVSSSALPRSQQPCRLCKTGTLGNKASASAARLNRSFHSGHLYSFPVL